MRFYKENKVNPLPPASRLSRSFRSSSPCSTSSATSCPADIGCEAGHCGSEASFLFIHDLTAKATGGELIALLILYVGTQLISGMVMSVTADKSQRTMMFVLPLIFVPFVINFPAGLVLYWITTNVWTIGQQYTIQRIIPVRMWLRRRRSPPPNRLLLRPKRRRSGDRWGLGRDGVPLPTNFGPWVGRGRLAAVGLPEKYKPWGGYPSLLRQPFGRFFAIPGRLGRSDGVGPTFLIT